jgi:hypothetical protein
MGYTCAYCGIIKGTFKHYTRHLRIFHENLPNFSVNCNIDGCKDTFIRVRGLVRHIARKHKNVPLDADESVTADGNVMDCDDDGDGYCDGDGETGNSTREMQPTVDNKFTASCLAQSVSDFEKHVTQCILKLREKHILPVCVQQDLIAEMQLMVSHIHDIYKVMFDTFCEEHDIADQSSEGMGSFLTNDKSVFADVFDKIDTEYKLNKMIRTEFMFVQPIEIVLGSQPGKKPAVFSYIPVTSVLKLVLSNDEIRHHILSRQNLSCSGDGMYSFVDGTIYKQHAFFSINPNAIRLHFYLDEFEVCNPIGSKRGKHKVLGIYYVIGNLDTKFLSTIKFIHLSTLVRYKHLRQYDPDYVQLLKPLIDELKNLAVTGIDIVADNVTYNFRAGLATFSADNLSAHSLAGFQCHFGHGRICRYCMASRDEIGSSFQEDNFRLRSKNVHQYHIEALQEN